MRKLNYAILILTLTFPFFTTAQNIEKRHCATSDRPIDKNGFEIICGNRIHKNEFISTRSMTYAFENKSQQLSVTAAKNAIKSAFSTWNNATGISFKEVNLGSKPDIIFQWSSNKSVFPSNELAHVPHWDCNGNYFGARIRINENHLWSTNNKYGTFDLESVVLHELGHIIGLGHNDIHASSIMRRSFGPNDINRTLSIQDENTVEMLFPGKHFSNRDNLRGFSWNKASKNVSYIVWDYTTKKTKLILRKYNGKSFYGQIKIQTFSTADNIRGWSYDENAKVCSYLVYDKNNKKSILITRSFNGWNFGKNIKKITMGSSDNYRGWSWNKAKKKCSYLANNGYGVHTLYIRSFDGGKFSGSIKKIGMGKKNTFRGWNWDIVSLYCNYGSYIRAGRNSLIFDRSFNGSNFGKVD